MYLKLPLDKKKDTKTCSLRCKQPWQCNDYSTWPCKGGMYLKCLQMLWKQNLFQNCISFDKLNSDHKSTWKKKDEQAVFILCNYNSYSLRILPQALPAINALKEFESSASGMHSMKPTCNCREKKKAKVLFLVLFKALPKGVLVKDPGQDIAHLKVKHLWHFDVNLTIHCESLFAFTARSILWTAEPRSTDAKVHLNSTSSINNFGQLEFLQQWTGFRALRHLQSSSSNFLLNSYVKHLSLSLRHGGIEAELIRAWGSLANTPTIATGSSYHTVVFCHSAPTHSCLSNVTLPGK